MFTKIYFVLASICFFINQSDAAFRNNSLECHKNVLQEVDDYLKQLEMINHPTSKRFPETMEELHEACLVNKKVTNMMSKLADKCMTGFSKNIIQVSIYSIKRSRKTLCKTKPTKDVVEFLEAGKCINGGLNQFKDCLLRTQANIMSLRRVESKMRIPFICCETVRAKECLMETAKNVKECTEAHVELLQNRFQMVSQNPMNMACGEYTEDSDKCDFVQPPEGIDYSAPPKSFMMSALELIDLFENDPELRDL